MSVKKVLGRDYFPRPMNARFPKSPKTALMIINFCTQNFTISSRSHESRIKVRLIVCWMGGTVDRKGGDCYVLF